MENSVIKKNTIYKIIRYLVFLSVFALFATLAAFQERTYNGDGVLWHLFYEDVFLNGGNFFDWKLSPGMSINLELMLRCIAAFISNNNIVLSAIIDTFTQAVLLFFAMNFLFQELGRNNDGSNESGYYNYKLCQFLLFFIVLSCMYSGVTFTGVFNYYVPSDITLSFLVLTFFIKYYKTHQNKYLLIFLSCLVFSVSGSRKFLCFFAIPLMVTLFLFYFQKFSDRRKNRIIVKSLILSIIAIVVADQIILKLISPNFAATLPYLGEQAGLSIKLNNFIKETIYLRDKGGYFHAAAALIFSGSVVFLFFLGFKLFFSVWRNHFHMNGDGAREIDFPYSFLIILNMVIFSSTMLSTFIFTSATPSKKIYSYSIFHYYSFTCVWSFSFVAYKMTQTRIFSSGNYTRLDYLGFISVFVVFFLAIYQLKTSPFTLKSAINYETNFVDMANARCIDENREKYNLNHGIATFWTAQPVTAMSKKGIRVNQVYNFTDLLPYYWQNNKKWFLKGTPGSGEPYYNFIIISTNDPERSEFYIRQKFGNEAASFECSECSDIKKVLVYPDDTNFDARLKHYSLNTPDNFSSEKVSWDWFFYATELEINRAISSMLEFNDTSFSTLSNTTPEGLLTYGPYLKDLEEGQYEIILTCEIAGLKSSKSALRWDILLNKHNVIDRGEATINKKGIQRFRYKFILDKPTDFFEFRTFLNNPETKVTLYHLKIRKLQDRKKRLAYSDGTSFDARLKHYWLNAPDSIFSQKERWEWSFYATEFVINSTISSMLEFCGTSLRTLINITPEGLLTHGPYLKDLKKGRYEIVLTYEIADLESSKPALGWDIVLNMHNVIDRGELDTNNNGIQTFRYQLDLSELTDIFEFRTFLINPHAKVTLYHLKIKKLQNKNGSVLNEKVHSY